MNTDMDIIEVNKNQIQMYQLWYPLNSNTYKDTNIHNDILADTNIADILDTHIPIFFPKATQNHDKIC